VSHAPDESENQGDRSPAKRYDESNGGDAVEAEQPVIREVPPVQDDDVQPLIAVPHDEPGDIGQYGVARMEQGCDARHDYAKEQRHVQHDHKARGVHPQVKDGSDYLCERSHSQCCEKDSSVSCERVHVVVTN